MFDNALKVSTSTKYYLSNKSVLNSSGLEYTRMTFAGNLCMYLP